MGIELSFIVVGVINAFLLINLLILHHLTENMCASEREEAHTRTRGVQT